LIKHAGNGKRALSKLIRLEKLKANEFAGLDVSAVIGFFDGVHVGHLTIIKACVAKAEEIGGVSLVFTFDNPPVNILKGRLDKKLITSYRDKINLIKKIGVDYIVVAGFNHRFANLEPFEFCKDILAGKLNARELFIGKGFKFGKNSKGDTGFLKRFFEPVNVNINEVDIYKIDNTAVSSTAIRKLYSEGDIDNIARFLGRQPSIRGKVIKGDKRGRLIGFPTANIDVFENYITLKDGVYTGYVNICSRHGSIVENADAAAKRRLKKLPSVINIGNNPTFEGSRKWIETYIIDFNGDIYGKMIEVVFLQRQRDEIAFKSKNGLVKQISSDVENARKYFKNVEGFKVMGQTINKL